LICIGIGYGFGTDGVNEGDVCTGVTVVFEETVCAGVTAALSDVEVYAEAAQTTARIKTMMNIFFIVVPFLCVLDFVCDFLHNPFDHMFFNLDQRIVIRGRISI
jgi:hypothetical protein